MKKVKSKKLKVKILLFTFAFCLLPVAFAYAQAWDRGACERVTTGSQPPCPSLQATVAPTIQPPSVTITGPAQAQTTATITITGTGTAGEIAPGVNSTIKGYSCSNNRGGTCTIAGSGTSWTSASHTLSVGVNIVSVTITNAAGATATDTRTFTFTPTHPGNALVFASGFETGSGLTAIDSSGAGNDGTLVNGAAWTTNGKFGNAISLDGTNDYVSIPDSNSVDFTSGFTLTAWVQSAIVPSGFRTLFYKQTAPVAGAAQWLYASVGSGTCGAGAISAGIYTNGNIGPQFNTCHVTPLQPGVWTHLALRYNGTTLELFKNGVSLASVAATGLMEPTTGIWQIGCSVFPGECLSGLVDEVRMYNAPIAVTAGLNKSPGAACAVSVGFTDYTDQSKKDFTLASMIGDMNCRVVPTVVIPPAAPLELKIGSGFKMGTGIQFGSSTP